MATHSQKAESFKTLEDWRAALFPDQTTAMKKSEQGMTPTDIATAWAARAVQALPVRERQC